LPLAFGVLRLVRMCRRRVESAGRPEPFRPSQIRWVTKAGTISGKTMFRLPHRLIPCEPDAQGNHNRLFRLNFL
jgi:hypothetical protein